MSEYSAHDQETGKWTQLYDLEECLRAIKVRNQNNEDRIKRLEEENKILKEEYSKDEDIQKMKQQLNRMKEDYRRGFPISGQEEKNIEKWKKKHDKEVHGYITDKMRLKAEGCCGGRYSYHFIPTSIGVSGVVKCNCGAEFEFSEIR